MCTVLAVLLTIMAEKPAKVDAILQTPHVIILQHKKTEMITVWTQSKEDSGLFCFQQSEKS